MIIVVFGRDELAKYYPIAREPFSLRQVSKIEGAGFWRRLQSSFRRLRQVEGFYRFRFVAMTSGSHAPYFLRQLNVTNVEISKTK
jgi:hypothetical protein